MKSPKLQAVRIGTAFFRHIFERMLSRGVDCMWFVFKHIKPNHQKSMQTMLKAWFSPHGSLNNHLKIYRTFCAFNSFLLKFEFMYRFKWRTMISVFSEEIVMCWYSLWNPLCEWSTAQWQAICAFSSASGCVQSFQKCRVHRYRHISGTTLAQRRKLSWQAHCRQIVVCPLTSVFLCIQGSVRFVLTRSALLECDDDDDVKDSH